MSKANNKQKTGSLGSIAPQIAWARMSLQAINVILGHKQTFRDGRPMSLYPRKPKCRSVRFAPDSDIGKVLDVLGRGAHVLNVGATQDKLPPVHVAFISLNSD